MADKRSPFLYPGDVSTADSLAIVHLKRDLQIPTILKEHDEDDEGYSEGKVINTRFGSFPHTTLIGLPWGSQVRASKVDTGSRGRRAQAEEKKRKREDSDTTNAPNKLPKLDNGEEIDGNISTPTTTKEEKEPVAASSGFIHLLPPTPENWTSSLPHRTQVVYTPDYSYILHRLRARPGTNIIEAGAGSGSFTHASARAVFSGYPQDGDVNALPSKKRKLGKVWSFEFHEQRHEKLVKEIEDHGLADVVEITHRDVCADGFLVNRKSLDEGVSSNIRGGKSSLNGKDVSKDTEVLGKDCENPVSESEMISPNAEAVFLDLPAPWLALPHLVRSKSTEKSSKPFISPLNPTEAVQICTFSPCIEQVQRTVSTMRHLGWVDIEMVELSQKRFEIRRERIGIDNGAQRGLQQTPASVEEAVNRLLEVEGAFKSFHGTGDKSAQVKKRDRPNPNNRETILESLVERKIYKEGRLVHRTEPEVKTHTSYLVFAVLPREWSEEDERKAREKWPIMDRKEDGRAEMTEPTKSKKQLKRDARQAAREVKEASTSEKPSGVERDDDGAKGDAMDI